MTAPGTDRINFASTLPGTTRAFQRRVLARLFLVALLGASLLTLSGYIQARQSSDNFAGIVVSFGNGVVETACINLGADGEATGDELLEDSGLVVQTVSSTSDNTAVCKIEDTGCTQPGTSCFCECSGGGDCTYWAYFHLENGDWEYENRPPNLYTVNPGDVEGWSWGEGEIRRSGTPPPVRTFEEICGAQTEQDEDPTATDEPTSEPTETATTSSRQTAQPSPSRTATRTASPAATGTSRPTSNPTDRAPRETALPTNTPEAALLTCFPGSVTLIEGTGPPRTELLLLFKERAVGGGTSDAAGWYSIPLTVGSERPGDYLVQVITRAQRLPVRELLCRVPVPTPTQPDFIP